jgi:MYXO-CTERM domain-containing protein
MPKWSFIFVILICYVAHASVKEPNGLVVPRDRTDPTEPDYDPLYTETPLNKYFASQMETFDWLVDAQTTPSTFVPLCGFTARFVFNQASNKYGLAWYNTGPSVTTPPTGAALHTIVAAGSAVGTVAMSADIKNDPAYGGGAIGFALVGGQTHYSERRFNVTCTACTPVAPWVTAVIYKSTKVAGGYYLAFEDNNVTASSFANDGDFNDDVFLVTGLSCQGGGKLCQTGQPGICADGVTECDAAGNVICRAVRSKSPTEICNGLDDDCNGLPDDGATCPPGELCDRGRCHKPCGGGEFECGVSDICDKGFCVEPACFNIDCPVGQVCVGGHCQGGCDHVACPHGQVCRLGRCEDPCAGVTCTGKTVCNNGACVPSCDCLGCGANLTCAPSGLCEDPACASLDAACAQGTHCQAGTCVDSCINAMCPPGQTCTKGQCVALPPIDMSAPPPEDLAVTSDGDVPVLDAGDTHTTRPEPSGCSCRMGGEITAASWWPLILLMAFLRRELRTFVSTQKSKKAFTSASHP